MVNFWGEGCRVSPQHTVLIFRLLPGDFFWRQISRKYVILNTNDNEILFLTL